MKRNTLYFIALFVQLTGFLGCVEKKANTVSPDTLSENTFNPILVDFKTLDTLTEKKLRDSALIDIPTLFRSLIPLKYDVATFKIIYTTTHYDGSIIPVSALVAVPVHAMTIRYPIVLYMHGTIPEHLDSLAPSYVNLPSEAGAAAVLASNGYIVIAPDYIGYGHSKELKHPYEHKTTLGYTGIHTIECGFKLLNDQKIEYQNTLFIAGYSEGGTGCLSVLAVNSTLKKPLIFKGAIAGAGSYDKLAFASHIVSQESPLNFINYYCWVLTTYNTIYNLNRPLSYFFTSNNAVKLEQNIWSEIDKNPKDLFNNDFKKGILKKSDSSFVAIFKENSLTSFKSTSKLMLVHGNADDFVPIFNSQNAVMSLSSLGNDVKLRVVSGNHSTAIPGYFLEVFKFLNEMDPSR